MAALQPLKAFWGALLAAVAVYGAYLAWDGARFAFLRSADPRAALATRPHDALALSKVLDQGLQRQPEAQISGEDARAARDALAQAPLSRGLLRIVGLKAEIDGDLAKADTALTLSDRVSRRDALTQLWLIERSVGKDDMKGAVAHYHAALSVHPELGPALFPILAKAIAFPEVRAALRPYIARRTVWSIQMVGIAAAEGSPVHTALLIMPLKEVVQSKSYEPTNARLMSRLVDTGDFALANRLAETVVPGLQPAQLATLGVNDTTTDARLGTLAWKLAEEQGILASASETGGIEVDVDPLRRGRVASRIVAVSGGHTYIFGQTLRGSLDASNSDLALNWHAFCVPSTTKILVWQQLLPKIRRTQRYESTIKVPETCKGLDLVLTARGPEGQQPGHFAIEDLDLRLQPN